LAAKGAGRRNAKAFGAGEANSALLKYRLAEISSSLIFFLVRIDRLAEPSRLLDDQCHACVVVVSRDGTKIATAE
jgi:hypothetical protein